MNPQELLKLGRRLYHATPDVPSSRIRIAVTQAEWDAMNEYILTHGMSNQRREEATVALGVCGIRLVVVE